MRICVKPCWPCRAASGRRLSEPDRPTGRRRYDDFTRVANCWVWQPEKITAGTLRIGELKAMRHLAGGDLDQALAWTEWTMS
ncbi:MAG: hypothetical protein ACLTXH_02560 [Enterobacter hormaechei]